MMQHHNLNLEGIMVKTTNGVAVAGVFSPAWLPTLNDASQIAAQLVRHHQAGNKVAVAALREEFGLTGEQMADAIQQLQTEVLIGAHRIRR